MAENSTAEQKSDLNASYFERRHPDYAGKLAHWEFVEQTYYGGRKWFDSNIHKYHREGAAAFEARIKRAYRFNHTREVVDLITKYVFKGEVKRSDDAPETVQGFWRRATKNGRDISALMRQVSQMTSVNDLGDYLFEVRSVDMLGNTSIYNSLVHTAQGLAALKAPIVSDLHLVEGSGVEFVGLDARFAWKNSFPSTTTSGATESGNSQETSPLFSHSMVDIYDTTDSTLLRSERVAANSYTYDYTSNEKDCAAIGRQPTRNIRIEVVTYDIKGRASEPQSLDVSNPVPPQIVPVVDVTAWTISVGIPSSAPVDTKGLRVWIEDNDSFDPQATTPRYDGPTGMAIWTGQPGTTYFVRAGIYDQFDDSMVVSDPVEITTDTTISHEIQPILDDLSKVSSEIPRIDNGLEEAYQRLTELQWAQFTTGETLAGAGIFVDSETGEVRVTAFERAEHRVSNVELNLSAVEASLSLKASVAYVDDTVSQAISEAVLDPSQIPVINDINLRITDSELRIDAAEGEIESLTDTLTVAGGLVTMTTVTSRLDSLEGEIVNKVASTTFDALEERTTAAEDKLTALPDAAEISSSVEATRRQALDQDDLIQNNIGELWDRWQGDLDVREASARGYRDLSARVDDGFVAEAAERAVLVAEQNDLQATVIEERVARTSADEALSLSLAQLGATVDGANTAISDLQTTKVDAEGALAAVNQEISATYPTGIAGLAQAATDATSWISTTGAVKVDATGAIAAVNDQISVSFPIGITELAQDMVDASAWITEVGEAKVDADGAVTAVNTVISATYPTGLTGLAQAATDSTSWISTTGAAKVNAAGAVAAVEAEIVAEYASLSAMATELTTVKTSTDELSASYLLRVKAGTSGAQLELVARDDLDGGAVSTARIAADEIVLDGSVKAKHIEVNSITADKLNVTELSAVSGTIGTFKTSPTGERTEISDSGMKIYDATGLLVVELGELEVLP